MDAVQAVQITTNAVNAVPAGAGTLAEGAGGASASSLFRSMFEEAAAAVVPQAVASQTPAGGLQTVRGRAVSELFTRGAASASIPLTLDHDGGGEPVARESEAAAPHAAAAAPACRMGRKEQLAEARQNLFARGYVRKGAVKGNSPGILPDPALMENRQAMEGTEAPVMESPPEKGGDRPALKNSEPVSPVESTMVGRGDATVPDIPAPLKEVQLWQEAQGGVSPGTTAGLPAVPGDGTSSPTKGAVADAARGAYASVREGMASGTERNSQSMELPRPGDSLIPAGTGVDTPGPVRQQPGMERVVQPMTTAGGAESSLGDTEPVDAGFKGIAGKTAMKYTAAVSAQGSDYRAGKTPESPAVPPGFPDIDPESLAVPPGFPDIDPESLAVPPGFPVIDETGPRVRDNNRGGAKQMAGNGLQNSFQRHNQELKAEVKGETVLRQLPGGVTVLNPAQTTGMGGFPFPDERTPAVAQHDAKGRISTRGVEQGSEPPAIDPATEIAGKRETFSRGDGAERQGNPETGKGTQAFPGNHVSFGDPDTPVRGLGEVQSRQPSETDRGRLHGEILSQVSDRLANHNPVSGDSRITLKLNPGELGELQLNVRMEDRKMSVEVTAQNPVVKEALLQNLDQLKDTLSRQNIQMERFDVSTGTGQQGAGQSFREGRQTAHRLFDETPFSPAGYFLEDEVAVSAAGWEPRENSLVDMRL